jgi:hypothetical protein
VGQEKQGNKVENPWNVRIYSTNMLVLFQKGKKKTGLRRGLIDTVVKVKELA